VPAARARPPARPAGPRCRPGRWTCRRPARAPRSAAQVGRQRVDGRVDVAQVRGVLALALRGAHADEVHLGVGDLGHVGGEAQPAGRHDLLQQLGQPGLVEGGLALAEQRDLGLVDVDPDDLVAQLGHAGGVDGTEVATTDHRDTHGGRPSARSPRTRSPRSPPRWTVTPGSRRRPTTPWSRPTSTPRTSPRSTTASGAGALEVCLVIEEVARVCASSSLIPAVNKLGTMPLIVGPPTTSRRYLPQVAAGEAMFSYALSEREAGSDTGSMKTRAVAGDGDAGCSTGRSRGSPTPGSPSTTP
jgi:hypothetical protein